MSADPQYIPRVFNERLSPSTPYDCAVIGGGPGGIATALYLRRYHRSVIVFDAAQSRARWIPRSHNCPGFPHGISGTALLARLREQAASFDVRPVEATVVQLHQRAGTFTLVDDQGLACAAATVVLATGVVDVLPAESWISAAISTGAIGLCAICDAFEASGQRLAVYGPINSAISHAVFLRSYSHQVCAIASDDQPPDPDKDRLASEAGITLYTKPRALSYDGEHCSIIRASGEHCVFDVLYPAMGSRSQSSLARHLGAEVDDNAELVVSSRQMTSVAQLYAVGDVVSAINQIAVASGHAAIAATAIHNSLPRRWR